MAKRLLSVILSVCLLFGVCACIASAAAAPVLEGEIPLKVRICPGKIIDIDHPVASGNVYAEGWEIKIIGGDWIPYDGEPLDMNDEGASIRYFAANFSGDYVYSNEATLIVKHNGIGAYKYDDLEHWRDCSDCDGQADKAGHTNLGETATAADNVCEVCGQRRTTSLNGLLVFWEWLMALIGSLLG